MSETTGSLKDLGDFRPQSPLATNDARRANDALWMLVKSLEPRRPVHRRVGDLMAAVRALTARTARVAQPRVTVDIDVFAPGGQRALRLFLPDAH